MPDVGALVDVEALIVAHLALDDDLGPLVGGPGPASRISTDLQSTFRPEGRVKVARVGGTPVTVPEYLDRALVQIDGYGATKAEAFAVTAATLGALWRATVEAHAAGVVTAVERVTGPTWSPDPETDAPRYLTTMAVTVHPA